MTKKLYCFSRKEFINMLPLPENTAAISIIETQQCQDYYKRKEPHPLPSSDENVFNAVFDDINTDTFSYDGCTFTGLLEDQARKLALFIDRQVKEGRDIYVHCRAGKSRSQGVIDYIKTVYQGIDWELRKDNPCLTPNAQVKSALMRCARELGLGEYKKEID